MLQRWKNQYRTDAPTMGFAPDVVPAQAKRQRTVAVPDAYPTEQRPAYPTEGRPDYVIERPAARPAAARRPTPTAVASARLEQAPLVRSDLGWPGTPTPLGWAQRTTTDVITLP